MLIFAIADGKILNAVAFRTVEESLGRRQWVVPPLKDFAGFRGGGNEAHVTERVDPVS